MACISRTTIGPHTLNYFQARCRAGLEVEQGHIPGAVGFNWQRELQDQVQRAPVSKEHLEALLSRAGVTPDTTIVLYGDNNNWFAAWALWILKYYGHRDVRLLNGGRVKWLADKREITTVVPSYPHTSYTAHAPNGDIRAFRDQILHALKQSRVTLVDVRSPAEYSGELPAPAHLPFDDAPLSFWERYGRCTVERLALPPGANVLDVGCGTGASALPAAGLVGPDGTVQGVDLAEKLLAEVRAKAAQRRLQNVEVCLADMTA